MEIPLINSWSETIGVVALIGLCIIFLLVGERAPYLLKCLVYLEEISLSKSHNINKIYESQRTDEITHTHCNARFYCQGCNNRPLGPKQCEGLRGYNTSVIGDNNSRRF